MNFSIFVFLAIVFSFPPTEAPESGFEQVDQHARSLSKSGNYEQMAEKLTAPFDSESEKARAIFIWITEHIAYDLNKYKQQRAHPKRTRIEANSQEELELIKTKHRMDLANKAFHREKGVCEDYAYLFQFMGEHVGLETAFIPGYGRFSAQEIGRQPRGSNHAWNAVKIDDLWYLLDATWAAGTTDTRSGSFKKDYKEGLFMTPPDRFILTHFPDDPDWQLLEQPVSLESFINTPYAFPELSNAIISDYFPREGIIKKSREGAKLGIISADPSLELVLIENRNMTRYKANYANDRYVFEVPGGKLRAGELTIGLIRDQKLHPVISYWVK